VIWLVFYVVTAALGIIGWFATRRDWRISFLPVLMIAYSTALHMLSVASSRYRLPMVAILLYFSALGLAYVLERWHGPAPSTLLRPDPFLPPTRLSVSFTRPGGGARPPRA
jgi:hypothetical protein